MVLIDLCHSQLQTKVECDKPSSDNYDVYNLLSNTGRGFLVYPCIKPPINIDFDFLCTIKLSHIIIWPSVGAQKSTSFKISIKRNNKNNSIEANSSYYQISTGDLTKFDNGIIFCINSRANELVKNNQNFAVKLINNRLNIINNVNSLRLTIARTEKSVAALQRIEIWGHVAYNKLQQFGIENTRSILQNDISYKNCSSEKPETLEESSTTVETTKEIPEDYLDPITCAIMIQPILLPSGKVIDYNTLEKFGENEALWGRPLSDPFTGIPFSDHRKPIFADSIKCQIDKFITENSDHHEFQKMPRVLGPHGAKTLAIKQHRNDLLALPNIYNIKHARPINSSSSMAKPSIQFYEAKHPGNTKLKHKMPINTNKLRNLLIERRKKSNIKRITVANVLESNLLISTVNGNINIDCDASSSSVDKVMNSVKTKQETNRTITSIDDNLQKNLNNILFGLKNFSKIKKVDAII